MTQSLVNFINYLQFIFEKTLFEVLNNFIGNFKLVMSCRFIYRRLWLQEFNSNFIAVNHKYFLVANDTK